MFVFYNHYEITHLECCNFWPRGGNFCMYTTTWAPWKINVMSVQFFTLLEMALLRAKN